MMMMQMFMMYIHLDIDSAMIMMMTINDNTNDNNVDAKPKRAVSPSVSMVPSNRRSNISRVQCKPLQDLKSSVYITF